MRNQVKNNFIKLVGLVKSTGKTFGALLLIAVGAVAFQACSEKTVANSESTEAEQLPVTRLQTIDTVISYNYVADIQALKNVEIRARVHGFIEEIRVDEGGFVRKGQILFKISRAEYEQELAQAKANLVQVKAEVAAAELELKRVKTLVQNDIISETEQSLAQSKLELARAKVEQAKSQIRNAEIKLSYTLVEAPFDGIVNRMPLKLGSLVEQGSLLTIVSDNSGVFAYFNLSESEYLNYQKTLVTKKTLQLDSLELTLADGTRYPYHGKVETIDANISSNTGSIGLRARFPNPAKLLRHGASGRITLLNEADDILVVPQKSVFEMQDRNFVFVLGANNQVHMRSIHIKGRLNKLFIVSEGVKPGETIVVEGVQNLQDGMKIKPVNIGLDSLLREIV